MVNGGAREEEERESKEKRGAKRQRTKRVYSQTGRVL